VPISDPAPAIIPAAVTAIVPSRVLATTLNLPTAPLLNLPTAPIPNLPTVPILDPAPATLAAPGAAPIRRRRTLRPSLISASNPGSNPFAPAPTGVSKGRKRKNPEITQKDRKTLERGIHNKRIGKGPSKDQQEMMNKYPDLSRRLLAAPPAPPTPSPTAPSPTPPNAVAPPDVSFPSWDDVVRETARTVPFPYPGARFHAPEAAIPAPAPARGPTHFYLRLAALAYGPPDLSPVRTVSPVQWAPNISPENIAPGAYQSAGQTMIRTHKM